jgi:signal transduction histidine kinase
MAPRLLPPEPVARKRRQGDVSGYTILVVDDQEETLASVKLVLEREGHRVLLADCGERALELFGRQRVDLLLVDYFMPRMTGEELVAEIRKVDTEVQIVLQTGYSGEKPPREMLHTLDIQGYHDKGDGPDKLLLWVDVALKASEQLRRAREMELLKSQLLANLSHEFRTPLHVILGYAEIMREDRLVLAAGHDTLGRIRRNAEALLQLVDDFLRLSDLDAGVATAACDGAGVDAATLRHELAKCADLLIRDKPLACGWRVPDTLPVIAADPAKLGIIAMNLLSNAVKFTATGTITVTAESDAESVVLAVQDTGIGIAPDHHERIFEPFRQVDGSTTRLHEGTGIGLSIARKLARLMRGDITVASSLGKGATFRLRLPRLRPEASGRGAAPEPPASLGAGA